MKRKIIFSISVIVVILAISTAIFFLINSNTNHYEKSKSQSISFLEKNEDEIISIAESLMAEDVNTSKEYKNKYCIYKNLNDELRYVKIDIDSKGFLGGQYWGIIYCPENNYIESDSDIAIFDESKTGNGNNISIHQKIKDNWYFYYDDYDGKIDVNSIK